MLEISSIPKIKKQKIIDPTTTKKKKILPETLKQYTTKVWNHNINEHRIYKSYEIRLKFIKFKTRDYFPHHSFVAMET
jgi:hypothetical protein